MDNKFNGHINTSYAEYQDQRLDGLETVLRQGFQSVTEELKALRQEGSIPVSVFQKIQEQQSKVIHPIIRVLCSALILTILWFTGLKAALPHIFTHQ